MVGVGGRLVLGSSWGGKGLIPGQGTKLNKAALISHASKVMPKIIQAKSRVHEPRTLQIYKLDSEKAEEPENKLPTSIGS